MALEKKTAKSTTPRPGGGAQTVVRALDILDALAERPMMLSELAARVGLSTTTCYRLATVLANRGLLATSGRSGFALGHHVLELAASMEGQSDQSRPI